MYTFGELLRGFRKREGYSQQQLADNIGKGRNTISYWETSYYLPKNSDIIFKLAEELHLSLDETNQLLMAAGYPPVSLPPSHLPPIVPPPNRHNGEVIIELNGVPITIQEKDILSAIQVSASLPDTPTAEKLSKAQIKELAKRFNLLESMKMNPALRLLDGDISYWYEQGLSRDELISQFEARKAILDAADRDSVRIDDQGTLSSAVPQLMPELLRAKAGLGLKKGTFGGQKKIGTSEHFRPNSSSNSALKSAWRILKRPLQDFFARFWA